jgi:hypothetical protein
MDKAGDLRITLTALEASDKALKLAYRISNESDQDAWIFAGFGKSGTHASSFMDEDGRTLVISSRFLLPLVPKQASSLRLAQGEAAGFTGTCRPYPSRLAG